ncbi:MAG: SiaB family protein kinase [Bacteroidales bacterium]
MLSKSILSYQGPLKFSTIAWLLSEFKMAAHDHSLSHRAYKKTISIMIEALENAFRYFEVTSRQSGTPCECTITFQINVEERGLELMTRNPIRRSDAATLRARIDHVNRHKGEELKQLFRDTITNGHFTASGGAGLGFIEMAKASGSKLQYQFEDLSEECVLYTLKVALKA